MHIHFLQIFIFSFLLTQVSFTTNSMASSKEENPINQADPTIFFYDGVYYLYGTNDKNASDGFIVYHSTDKMKTWTLKGTALRKGDSFGDRGFWAPHVWVHKGKFYMAYTANEKIAVAESDSPYGPFTQKNKVPIEYKYGQIDPFVFIDDDGKKYMYYVRLDGANKIWVAELNDDFLSMKEGTNVECITAQEGTWEHVNETKGKVAEGPTVVKHIGKYYLFYSANDFRLKDYAVGYAVSDNVYGPWTKFSGNPIIHQSNTGHAGSGHGDILKNADGSLLYVLHTHNSPAKVGPRKSAVIKLEAITKNGMTIFTAAKDSFKFLRLHK